MADVTPGNETSEFKALKWIGIIAGLLVAVMGSLTAAGVLPQEGLWATIIGAAFTVAKVAAAYAESRGAIKSAQVLAANPPKPPQP